MTFVDFIFKFFLRTRNVFRCGILAAVVIFYFYLRMRSISTRNWANDRVECYSQIESCTISPNTPYGIVDVHASGKVLPLCSYESSNGKSHVCFGMSSYSMLCLYEIDVQEDTLETTYTNKNNHVDYFHNTVLIIIFASCCLLFSIVFNPASRSASQEEDNSFISRRDMINMWRLNYFLTLILFILLMYSSYNYTTMQHEGCAIASSNGESVCTQLKNCKVEIRSILFASDSIVSSYASLALTLGIMLLVISCVAVVYDIIDMSGAVMPYDDDGDMELPIELPVRQRPTGPATDPISTIRRAVSRKIHKWKGPDIQSIKSTECPVCLEQLMAKPAETSTVTEMNSNLLLNSMSSVVMENGHYITQIPCGHIFHEYCICKWARGHATCPVCRANLDSGRQAPP